MTFTWKHSTKCLECSGLKPVTKLTDMELLTWYNLPLSGLIASCPQVCFSPPWHANLCRAAGPDWPVSFRAFRSFTSSSAVRLLFCNSACTWETHAIWNKTGRCGMSRLHFTSFYSRSKLHNKKPCSSLPQAASPCQPLLPASEQQAQISSSRSFTHKTGSYWISLLVDTPRPSPTQVLHSVVWLCHQPEPDGKETFWSGLHRDCQDIVPVNMCRLFLGWPHLALKVGFFHLAMEGKPVHTCRAAGPDWPVSSRAFRSFTSSSAVSFLFCNSACTWETHAIWNKTGRCGMSRLHFTSFYSRSKLHNKKPCSSLPQAASPCHPLLPASEQQAQISSSRSFTHKTGSYWISLLVDTPRPSPTQVLHSVVWLCHQPEPDGKETFWSGLHRDCQDIVPVNMCRLFLGWPHLALKVGFFHLAMEGKPVHTCRAAGPDWPVSSRAFRSFTSSSAVSFLFCNSACTWETHAISTEMCWQNRHASFCSRHVQKWMLDEKPSASLLQAVFPG